MHLLKKHNVNYLGSFIFIVLFFLFSFSIYEILIKSPAKVLHYELASVSSKDVVLNKIQQPSVYKNWLPQFDNSNFKVITKRIILLTNNRLILQRINFLQKIELSFIPVIPPGFYYHSSFLDTEDLPVLS